MIWTLPISGNDALRVEFGVSLHGMVGSINCTPLGELDITEAHEDWNEDYRRDWNMGLTSFCSILMTAINSGIVKEPQQAQKLANEFFEHLSNNLC